MKRFPAGFVWGAATSSYQIEGAAFTDGRSESVWDRFSATPGKIADGSTGMVACDHYRRYRDDVKLMAWLGIDSYRFSIAWPRVLPNGTGKINEKGLDFYERLVDALLDEGIKPCVTLYHWDLPQVLEDKGGWPVRATAEAFVEYAQVVTRRLGDRVEHWITHNEPWCAAILGYGTGYHAPGRRDFNAALAAGHHLLLSHAWAIRVIRENVKRAHAGITLNVSQVHAASSSDADRDAARAYDGQLNRWFLDPVFGRGYPQDVVHDYARAGRIRGPELPFVQDGDLTTIATKTDFLGINYYTRQVERSALVNEAENAPPEIIPSDDRTDMGWEVYPDGLREVLVRIHKDYAPSCIYVTENGAAYAHGPEGGKVQDTPRARYLHAHLHACLAAIEAGVPLAGYFVWSLFDNFEWAEGYAKRFGIVWVDYQTQERIAKESAHWYRSVIAENALLAAP